MNDVCNGCGDEIKEEDECTGFGFGDEEYIFCMDCSAKESNIEGMVKKIMLSMSTDNETIH
ncbi:MAG: hypothetical protein NZ811_05880 [Gammaproteobacteria bacterium]|nr:hypothetical protein [Gammaproteobacteria bacterium]